MAAAITIKELGRDTVDVAIEGGNLDATAQLCSSHRIASPLSLSPSRDAPKTFHKERI
ncbi:MAG: hypothetical protein WC763_06770 [Candidatus Paceibacterota bacterium]